MMPGSNEFKLRLMGLVPDCITRFLTNRCRMGIFLVSILEKGS